MNGERDIAPGTSESAGAPWTPGLAADGQDAALPVMPGFREMVLRRRAGEQAARMAAGRSRLVRELAAQRQAAGLSQTEIAARMGTSQSAVARLETGTADVLLSTVDRYASAIGWELRWSLEEEER